LIQSLETIIEGTFPNVPFAVMDSHDLARYIAANDGITKPWLLVQLRLAKLKERRSDISAEEYDRELADLHQELMQLGQWWQGQEDQVFRQGL
jgi:hypothetical protein